MKSCIVAYRRMKICGLDLRRSEAIKTSVGKISRLLEQPAMSEVTNVAFRS